MLVLQFQLTEFMGQRENHGKNHFWIGLTDKDISGTLKWRHGHQFPNEFKSYWEQGQPNDIGGKEVCVQVSNLGFNDNQFQWGMRDSQCDNRFSFVCEKRPNRGKADSDTFKFHDDKWYLTFINFRIFSWGYDLVKGLSVLKLM